MSEDHKKQLEQQLWNIANTLRGKMNADEFRDYILGFIFYKYLAEKIELYANKILKEGGDTFLFSEIDENTETGQEYIEAIREESLEKLGYFLKPSELFTSIAKRGNFNDEGEPLVKENESTYNTKDNFILEDLQKILNNIQNSTMGTDSEEDFEDLFEDMDLNSTKLGKTPEARNEIIAKVLAHLDKIDFKLENTELDVLGDAYEYLIGKFASGAGKKAGEFYTPQEVSMVLAKLVTTGKKKLKSVYDPTCGSGSLLLRVAKEVEEVNNFYGQELNRTTYNLARMNMILHGVHYRKFDIKQEDTLENPQHLEQRFEAIVANPPFSAKWSANKLFMSDDRFSQYGKLAPRSKADFAFVQHMIHHLSENGQMAVVLPHGALYRGGAESLIRKYLIKERNYLDAVIGLPSNIFYGTDIATSILLFKKCRENPDNILFIDGSSFSEKGQLQDYMSQDHIGEIIKLYNERKLVKERSYPASLKEIEKNNYFLNISRYVKHILEHKKVDFSSIAEGLNETTNEIEVVDNKLKQYCHNLGIHPPLAGFPFENILDGKLRFKNLNGKEFSEWRELKLKDLLTEHKIRNNDNRYDEVFSVAKEKGVVNQIEHLGRSYSSDDISNYKVVFNNDIVYTKSPTAGFPFGIIKQNKTKRTGVVSVLYAVFKPKSKDIGFLLDFYFNSSVHTYNYLRPIVNKGAKNTMNINNDIFLDGENLFFPTDDEEIKMMVDFIKTLLKKEALLKKNLKLMSSYNKGILQTVF